MSSLDGLAPTSVEFIDHRKVEWQQVRRTRYFFYQRFHYQYPGPIRQLKQRLVVLPANRYGDQTLRDHELKITAETADQRTSTDKWGNRVIELEVPHVESDVEFELLTTLERVGQPYIPPLVPLRKSQIFLQPTALTQPDERIAETARDLMSQTDGSRELAQLINDWVYDTMSYGWGITSVKTPAALALEGGKGLCQDYAHIMIAICREAGLPARYVSGHLLGEGGSHAWVEVLLPSEKSGSLRAVAFDPTNNRLANLSYITVATGRDYSDVSPTSGSFIAPYSGHLTFSKRAGITEIEYTDGQILKAS